MSRLPDPALQQAWQQRLHRFQHTDQSVAHFCQDENVSVASFYYWRKRLQRPDFVPVSVNCLAEPTIHTSDTIAIELPGGAVLKVASPSGSGLVQAIDAVLRATAGRPQA